MMGYAKIGQTTKGIHLRLRSRGIIIILWLAFIIKENMNPVVLVNIETCAVDQNIRIKVLAKLKLHHPYYNNSNVMISATHTHSYIILFYK